VTKAALQDKVIEMLKLLRPDQPESTSGITALLRDMQPHKSLVEALLRLPTQLSFFVVSVLFVWDQKSFVRNPDGNAIEQSSYDSYVRSCDWPGKLQVAVESVLKSINMGRQKDKDGKIANAVRVLKFALVSPWSSATFLRKTRFRDWSIVASLS
jgi:hypothetical protein